jgi:hypothetical protein
MVPSGTRQIEPCRREPKDKNPNWSISGVEVASGKPIRKGGGLRTPPFLMGFPEAGGRFDPKNQPIWAFMFRLPSAQLPAAGTQEWAGSRPNIKDSGVRYGVGPDPSPKGPWEPAENQR